MSADIILSLQRLSIRYDNFIAIDSLSLDVHAGEILGLLGPNGSGKSSTLAAIVGAVPYHSGQIRVAGHTFSQDSLAYRRQIGLVPQELAVFEELTVEQNLSFFGRLYGLHGKPLRQRLDEVLDFVCLSEQRSRIVRECSGGMQRRLNLGCALLHQPRLLLLDEPTVALDIQVRDAIFASLRQLREQGTAMVFTTHHLEEAEQLCDRIAILDQGRLRSLGTLAELCRAWHRGQVTSTSHPGRLEDLYLEMTGRSLRES